MLTATVFLLLLPSCADRIGYVQGVLSAADSLMQNYPQSALDTLLTIDSAAAASLRGRERADYALLMTEGRYKCWEPVAGDTSVFMSSDYYRRRGPEDRLARALMMRGAVLTERGDAEGAMAAYKEAEPVAERVGDLEQLGLINTRIGALYQQGFINDSAAIARYRKALECFEKTELSRHIMYAHVTLARMLVIDSVERALPHLEKALSMAELYGDRLCAISASDLICHIHQVEDNAESIISTVRTVLSKYGKEPQNPVEKRLYNSLLFKAAGGYISIGDAGSARYVCGLIHVSGQVDSMMMFSTYADIAALEGDKETFWKNKAKEYEVTVSILKDRYETRLLESELKADSLRLESELYKRERGIMVLILIIVLGAAAAVTVFYIIRKALRHQKAETAAYKVESDRLKALADKLDRQLSAQIRRAETEISSLTRIKIQEETERKSFEQKLAESKQADYALRNFLSQTYKAMREISDIYDVHRSNPSHLLPKSADTVRKFLTDINSYANTEIILNSVYPDFLDTLFHEFPDLRQEDRHLIMLTCLGFPGGAVCAVLGISETNLSTKKSRLAQKMGIGKSLAKYLNERLSAHNFSQTPSPVPSERVKRTV